MLTLTGPPSQELARRALAALDFTCLEPDAGRERVLWLCRSARTPYGPPAALCVHPEWVATCRAELDRLELAGVHVASVVNFPDGWSDAGRAEDEARHVLAAGADELDLVFPYRAFLAGDHALAGAVVRACRQACGSRPLKLILETSALGGPQRIRAAAELGLACGADFLKTSTGVGGAHASVDAACTLLEVLCARGHGGLKVSGGLRRLADVAPYFELADEMMGPYWATPDRFRIGASRLLAEILEVLGRDDAEPEP
jgi:deoxyribose-phosphate aldolase